jgi:ubiquinone/menaquinone biosynthesis C-methylase UbiE
MTNEAHKQEIIAQFSKQAGAYTAIAAHSDALEKLVRLSEVNKTDTVLDIACGSGIVACAFAEHARQVTGIDITSRMIEEAKKLQQKKGLHNLQWHIGEVQSLPYDNGSFSIVVSRFGFHHFPEPATVLAEMRRVCKKGGRVLVVDVALPVDKVDAYNRMEKLRDPSHTAALTHEEFIQLFEQAGLTNLQYDSYRMPIELEEQLTASFPQEGKKAQLKEMILQDVGVNALGIDAKEINGQIFIHYPVAVFTARK